MITRAKDDQNETLMKLMKESFQMIWRGFVHTKELVLGLASMQFVGNQIDHCILK